MSRRELEACAWDRTPVDQRRDVVYRSGSKSRTTEHLTGENREVRVFNPSGTTDASMSPFMPLWSLYSDELEQRCVHGREPKMRAPYSRGRKDYTGNVEGDLSGQPRARRPRCAA